MKILLTGASGLVGAALAHAAAQGGHEIIGIVGRWSENVPGVTGLLARDLSQAGEAAALVRGIHPEAIVNAAALAEPAACDAAPERSLRMNVEFPAELAEVAAEAGARLIHLSSEQVFDGEAAPFGSGDVARPLNFYGRQKRASEQRVLAAHASAAVVRIPLLLGNSLGGRRSVHEKLFEQWAAEERARLYTDEIRQVCSATSVAAMLLALAARPDLRGVFHWAGAEPVSRWEIGRRIAAHFGVAEKWLEPMARADTPEIAAKRPRDLSLRVAPLDSELGLKPETVAEAVAGLAWPAWARGLKFD